ncbi:polysaccharide lyase family 8 super-sandwich domain-containing protein [Erysipelothrix rhusiopathiae]|nr:polysaccharide lyase family 8 super-sandwich domain-containing protein [Erysipelothrix rhusiopathiae]
MDKAIHTREGFAFALSRSSNRISKYEYMSGDHLPYR